MGEPFDLDALIVEAQSEPFEFRFGGDVYSMPGQVDLRAVADLEAGRLEDALRRMLGPDQWAKLQSVPAVFGRRELVALMSAYARHGGVDVPEWSASSSSSASTATPSRPTSNGRTTSRS